jgi:cytochrome c oxidase cbb3-type subunit I/II
VPLYFAGFFQSLMWKQFTPDGFLVYKNFLDTAAGDQVRLLLLRAIGGSIYLTGVFIMVYNVVRTVKAGRLVANEEAEAPALEKRAAEPAAIGTAWIERRPIQCWSGAWWWWPSAASWRSCPPSW